MDWNISRGTALEKPKKDKLDIKRLEYRIQYIVREQLKEYIDSIKISYDNNYGKWEII
tara:strand:+ start:1840 stop:2013 length:174 start_codon:yes stop_codon:yes gene_type:complete